MSKRPIYMRSKWHSYGIMIALFAALVWFVFGYNPVPSFQNLVDKSELKGRLFSGKVKEIVSKQEQIKAYFMPKYEYISAGYWNGGISIDASYKITRKELSPILLKVGGSYHMTKYTGNYNRFDNRTAAEIRTSLTF